MPRDARNARTPSRPGAAVDERPVVFVPEGNDGALHGVAGEELVEGALPGSGVCPCGMRHDAVEVEDDGVEAGGGALVVAGATGTQPPSKPFRRPPQYPRAARHVVASEGPEGLDEPARRIDLQVLPPSQIAVGFSGLMPGQQVRAAVD